MCSSDLVLDGLPAGDGDSAIDGGGSVLGIAAPDQADLPDALGDGGLGHQYQIFYNLTCTFSKNTKILS